MIGTNNVAMENFTFLGAYEDILETFQGAYPSAARGVFYLDVWSEMVDKTSQVLEDLLEDEVHLTHQGYLLWSDVFAGFLQD